MPSRFENFREKVAESVITVFLSDYQLDEIKVNVQNVGVPGYELQTLVWHLRNIREKIKTSSSPSYLQKDYHEAFSVFAKLVDPSHGRHRGRDYIYLTWICKQILGSKKDEFKRIHLEDIYKIKMDLSHFESWKDDLKAAGKPTNIQDYKNLEELIEVLYPFEARLAQKLEKELRKTEGYTKVYEGPEGTLLLIYTKAAAQALGLGSRWCISARDPDNNFTKYHWSFPVFFYCLPQTDPQGRQIKYAGVGRDLYDMQDKVLKWLPESLKNLILAADRNLPEDQKKSLAWYHDIYKKLPGEEQKSTVLKYQQDIPPEWWEDMDYILGICGSVWVEEQSDNLQNPTLLKDKKFILTAVREEGFALKCSSKNLQDDYEIVLTAVQRRGGALEYASEKLRGNREIVSAAVGECGWALKHASEDLRGDREIVLKAVSEYGNALEFASKHLRNDREIVLAAVQRDGSALRYVSKELRKNREIVLIAVQQCGHALRVASQKLRHSPELVTAAVHQNGNALRAVPERLCKNRKLVLKAVRTGDFTTLHSVPEELRNNPKIVLAAVKKDGYALTYASEALRSRPDIVLTAINQNPNAIEFASQELLQDSKFILKALEKNPDIAEFISKEELSILLKEEGFQNGLVRIISESQKPEGFLKAFLVHPNHAVENPEGHVLSAIETFFKDVKWRGLVRECLQRAAALGREDKVFEVTRRIPELQIQQGLPTATAILNSNILEYPLSFQSISRSSSYKIGAVPRPS